jgi:hypothetical protein
MKDFEHVLKKLANDPYQFSSTTKKPSHLMPLGQAPNEVKTTMTQFRFVAWTQ